MTLLAGPTLGFLLGIAAVLAWQRWRRPLSGMPETW